MKKTALMIILPLLFSLCGCADYREIDRGYLVSAIGFAESGGKTSIYIEATFSSDVSDQPSERVVLSTEGDNVESAFKSLNSNLVKPLYFEQLGTAVFDAALSDEKRDEIIAFLKDIPRINLGIYVVKTDDVNLLFETKTPSGALGYDIIGLIKIYEKENATAVLNKLYHTTNGKSVLPTVNVADGNLIFNAWGEKV